MASSSRLDSSQLAPWSALCCRVLKLPTVHQLPSGAQAVAIICSLLGSEWLRHWLASGLPCQSWLSKLRAMKLRSGHTSRSTRLMLVGSGWRCQLVP